MSDPRDDDLVGLYRQLPRPEPPAALDAAVLAAARAAVRPRRPAWLAPVAAAAAMVLAVGVGWQLRHEPLRETTPAAAPAAEPVAQAAAGAAADAATVDVPEATSAIDEAKAEGERANRVPAAPAPAARPSPAPAVAAEAESMAAPAGADAGDEAPEPATSAPMAAKRAAREEQDDQRLEEIVVTGSRVAAPRQRTIATPAPAEPAAPPVADVAAAPPPPPAPPAPPVPRAPLEPATATAPQALSAERAAGAAAALDADAIAAAFDDIRALHDAGRRDEAVAALARLLDAHPALEIPQDLRELRE